MDVWVIALFLSPNRPLEIAFGTVLGTLPPVLSHTISV